MEARHLRYAVALAEHAHFGRAATALGIAQPPLSKQIAALEREVGARLFDRTRRGVFPTAAGTAFLVRARAALAEIGAASVDAARAARGESGGCAWASSPRPCWTRCRVCCAGSAGNGPE